MIDKHALAPWIKRFLLEYLPGDRNLARNTQKSYRDAIRLLVLFASTRLHKKADELLIDDLTGNLLREFMSYIEEERKCSILTRNQRLAAIHTMAHFISERNPEYLAWCSAIRTVSFKRSGRVPVTYLEKDEIDALLNAPDQTTRLGYRDHSVLLFLYNSGARADEVAQLTVGDLNLIRSSVDGQSSVRLHGKGNKVRFCPLWASTASELRKLTGGRVDTERVFLNRCVQPMTRFGVHDIVTRHARCRGADAGVSPHRYDNECRLSDAGRRARALALRTGSVAAGARGRVVGGDALTGTQRVAGNDRAKLPTGEEVRGTSARGRLHHPERRGLKPGAGLVRQ
jgi:integrase/recombinase XerD